MGQSTNDLTHTDRITRQGRTLVRAIEALDVIEPLTLLERIAAQLLQAWYRQRLQYGGWGSAS